MQWKEISTFVQIVIAAGIVDVWLLRLGKATPDRPGAANSLEEEFAEYGRPDSVRVAAGGARLTLASLLFVGIWYPEVAAWAGSGMAVLILGAVGFHARVGDPPIKSLPAFLMPAMSAFVGRAIGLFRVGFCGLLRDAASTCGPVARDRTGESLRSSPGKGCGARAPGSVDSASVRRADHPAHALRYQGVGRSAAGGNAESFRLFTRAPSTRFVGWSVVLTPGVVSGSSTADEAKRVGKNLVIMFCERFSNFAEALRPRDKVLSACQNTGS